VPNDANQWRGFPRTLDLSGWIVFTSLRNGMESDAPVLVTQISEALLEQTQIKNKIKLVPFLKKR